MLYDLEVSFENREKIIEVINSFGYDAYYKKDPGEKNIRPSWEAIYMRYGKDENYLEDFVISIANKKYHYHLVLSGNRREILMEMDKHKVSQLMSKDPHYFNSAKPLYYFEYDPTAKIR